MVRFALAQINTTVGDFSGNSAKVVQALERARANGADLVVFPEMTLSGYPPRDLIERRSFLQASEEALRSLLPHTRGVAAVVGLATSATENASRPACNTAAFLAGGRIVALRHKSLLPTYDVFDEDRYFVPASSNEPIDYQGVRYGVTICEDLWNDRSFWARTRYPIDPVERLVQRGAQVILNLSASPFHLGKPAFRRELVAAAARRHRRHVFLTNLVGGNDELIFDGHSLGFDPRGELICQAKGFQEELLYYDLEPEAVRSEPGSIAPLAASRGAEGLDALTLGLADYVHKCGFKQAVLGLSGGIDSALTAAIAARALGPENVLGVALPSRYSSTGSVEDARALAANLGIRFEIIPIEPMFQASLQTLEPLFAGLPADLAEENLQARIRGVLLMALSNKFGGLLLTTGNKSELAVGYCTLYGDMCGGLAVVADLPKNLVYELSRTVNAQAGREVIPASTLTKAPSAELRPGQTDQDTLPPYDVLDAILEAYVENLKTPEEIVAMGFEAQQVRETVRLIERSEYKRRQAAPGLRVTTRAFGMGRRVPIAQRFTENR